MRALLPAPRCHIDPDQNPTQARKRGAGILVQPIDADGIPMIKCN